MQLDRSGAGPLGPVAGGGVGDGEQGFPYVLLAMVQLVGQLGPGRGQDR